MTIFMSTMNTVPVGLISHYNGCATPLVVLAVLFIGAVAFVAAQLSDNVPSLLAS
jgi:hypothetical protein